MNELVEKKINELISPSDVEMLVKFNELKARVSVFEDEIKQELLAYIKENHLENEPLETDKISIIYKHPYTRMSVDTNKLKEEGLYDIFKKPVEVGESVSINVKYE